MEDLSKREKIKFWHDPDLNNLEVLRATYILHAFVPHAHETFAIGVIEAGGQAFTYRRSGHNQLVMPAGCVAVINPGTVHTGRAATQAGWTYRMIYPESGLLRRVAAEIVGQTRDIPYFSTPVIHDPHLAKWILRMHAALEDPITSQIERESRLLWAMAQLIVRHADANHPAQRVKQEPIYVRRIRSYLNDHFAASISLKDLSDLVNISPFHLLRMFRKSIGLPPHAYLLQIRINRAKKLLLAGAQIADVALEVGFVDQSHLSRHFKRMVGVSPGQYRRFRP